MRKPLTPPTRSGRSRSSLIARLVAVATLTIALLGALAMPAQAQAVETSVERTVFVGDNVAPLAPIVEGSAIRVVLIEGELPAGISLLASGNGAFTGSILAEGQTTALFEITDVDTSAQELRTVVFDAQLKPIEEVSVNLSAEVNEPFFALLVNAEEALATQTGGELPPGVALVGGQFLGGTPTVGGVYVSTFAVTNQSFGDRQNITLTITVGTAVVREQIAEVRLAITEAREQIAEMREMRTAINEAITKARAEITDLRLERAAATTRGERLAINEAIGEVRTAVRGLIDDRSEVNAAIREQREEIRALRAKRTELRDQLG